MNHKVIAAFAALALGTFALTGCSPAASEKSEDPDIWGYVAAEKNAQLELTEDQNGVDELVVDRVLAPGDAWVVVHADDNGAPGMRVGLTRIKKGESTDVKVKLEELTTPKVIVAIHADRGKASEFDFDMMNKEMSPDRPYFVNGKELAGVVTVREFGVKAGAGEAAIDVADQPGASGSIVVKSATAPTGAWLVVHLDDDGAPGQRVGLLHIPAGTSTDVSVTLEPLSLTDNLFVAVHADQNTPDVFEFDMMDKINSADQPFFVDGEEVAKKIKIR